MGYGNCVVCICSVVYSIFCFGVVVVILFEVYFVIEYLGLVFLIFDFDFDFD